MLLRILITILFLSCSPVCFADHEQYLKDNAGPDRAYERELPLLPAYCRCKAAIDRNRYKHEGKKWGRVFKSKGKRGKEWMHVHHYCFGLIALSRAQRGLGKRAHLLSRAEQEFNYMFRHSSPKFILMPEIHLKMGITQKLMGRDAKAVEHFIKATQLKRNYVAAYVHIIDFFKEHQNYKKAIETAKRGLKYSPNSKALKANLRELQSLSTTKQ
ncbi:MAG: hypothetical protein JRJ38_04580 [Deltaproteobacteria bacterium]|nr:hypothetical protein [Deltaproteobacteria bacterium]